MKRILFIDDEPRVLSGLRRMLIPLQNIWVAEFVDNAEAAIARVMSESFDVVVSDLRMPGTDGATLLREVKRINPRIVRIALSGQADRELALRATQFAHRFLTKPCDPKQLQHVVARACQLQGAIHAPKILEIVGAVTTLPSLPGVHAALMQALESDSVTPEQLADIIEKDPGISSKALQLVNSNLFSMADGVTDIRAAANLLGIEVLQQLALAAGVFENLDDGGWARNQQLLRHHEHLDLVTRIALQILPDDAQRPLCVTTCLLHDIGRLILPTEDDHGANSGGTSDQAHAQIGGYLLDLWGLPHNICEVVTYHHRPSLMGSTEFDLLGSVHVADALAHAIEANASPEDLLDAADFDLDYLADMDVEDDVEKWAAIAIASANSLSS